MQRQNQISSLADDGTSLESAARALIMADVGDDEDGSQCAYALEHICRVLGSKLGVIEAKRKLKHLQLKTGLTKNRSPVVLPEYDDFPEIG